MNVHEMMDICIVSNKLKPLSKGEWAIVDNLDKAIIDANIFPRDIIKFGIDSSERLCMILFRLLEYVLKTLDRIKCEEYLNNLYKYLLLNKEYLGLNIYTEKLSRMIWSVNYSSRVSQEKIKNRLFNILITLKIIELEEGQIIKLNDTRYRMFNKVKNNYVYIKLIGINHSIDDIGMILVRNNTFEIYKSETCSDLFDKENIINEIGLDNIDLVITSKILGVASLELEYRKRPFS